VQKIVIEIVIQIGKPCSTMQQIMIEIDTEQAQLYQCDRFHYADFRDWNRDWFFRTSSARSEKFWL